LSLRLVEYNIPDSTYTYLTTVVLVLPVIYFRIGLSSFYSNQILQSTIFSISIIVILLTQYFDLQQKRYNNLQFRISLIIHVITSITFILYFSISFFGIFNQILFTIMLFSLFLFSFILAPVNNSPTRIKDVKQRIGTQGFHNIIIFNDNGHKENSTLPIDFGIIGPNNFRKYYIGDYFALRQAALSNQLMPMQLAILLTIIIQNGMTLTQVNYFSLLFFASFSLGFGLRVYFAMNYSFQDLLDEITNRMMLTGDREFIHKKLNLLVNLSFILGGIILAITLFITTQPASESSIFQLFRFDVTIAFLMVFNIFSVLIYRNLWVKILWKQLVESVDKSQGAKITRPQFKNKTKKKKFNKKTK
jgi:hypothetical protein